MNPTALHRWLQALLDHGLPQRCCRCRTRVAGNLPLCDACRQELPWLDSACQTCGLPLPTPAPACGECLRAPPDFSRTLAMWRYEDTITRLIPAFKQRGHFSSGHLLAHLFGDFISDYLTQVDGAVRPDLLLPVPLHWRRRWQRGFNQSQFVARHLSRRLGIPVSHALCRQHHTPDQKGLPRHERLRNLRHSFRVTAAVQGKTIALIDDVMTTGATAREISRVLRRAGAARVDVWVLARTSRAHPVATRTPPAPERGTL